MRAVAWAACWLVARGGPACGPGDYSGCGAVRRAGAGRERVAVLLTGLVRTFDIVHPRLRKELVLPLEARGSSVDVFIQTSAASSCGIREMTNDACPKRAVRGFREPPDGAAVVGNGSRAADGAAEASLRDAIAALGAPNVRSVDFGGNATLERDIERMAVDAANRIRVDGDLNNNYEKHKNELYKAHQYWRMDRAFDAADAFARGDAKFFTGAEARDWGAPFAYDLAIWARLDVLVNARPSTPNLISIDQGDKRHVSEKTTFEYFVPPPLGAEPRGRCNVPSTWVFPPTRTIFFER